MQQPVSYVHPALDRLTERRRDPDWLAACLASPETRLVPVWKGRNLITGPRGAPEAVFPSVAAEPWRGLVRDPLLLGAVDGTVFIGADVSAMADPKADSVVAAAGVFVDLRNMGWMLPAGPGALLAQARALTWWHSRNRFCGVCGSPTEPVEAGTSRRCTDEACAVQVFPRLDPAVIVLIYHGDRILLGRQPGWPPGMHSVLAGFVEPGESLESCVAREIKEESGVELADIRYAASQPWPFPQSLMLAFTARAVTTEVTPDPEELEHVDWYDRAYLESVRHARIGHDPFAMPGGHSVARRLIDWWLDGALP